MGADGNEKTAQHEILIVDDTPANLQLLTIMLTEQGYRVRPATGGLQALRSVAAKVPDMILLDVNMPDMNGFEVCRRLKSDAQSRDIPLLFISALAESTDKIKGFEAGGLDYIVKPFVPEEVLARVRLHLRLHELTGHLEQKVRERTEELTAVNLELQQKIAEHKQTEETLRKSEGRFRDLLASVTSYMYTVAMECGRAVSTTHGPGCIAVTGFSAEDYAADSDLWHRMIPPEDRQAVLDAVQHVLTSQTAKTIEHRLQHKDGSIRWAQTTLVPNVSPEGQLLSYDGVITDITKRKASEEDDRLKHEWMVTILAIHQMQNDPSDQLEKFIVEQCVRQTGSEIGFCGMIDDDEKGINTHIWSENAMKDCAVSEKSSYFPIKEAGLWAEVIRRHEPVIVNDYTGFVPGKRGLPPGHIPLRRFLGMPIMDNRKVIGLLGLANKAAEYGEMEDVMHLRLLANGIGNIFQRRKYMDNLRESEERFKSLHDNLPVGVVMIDQKMRIMSINPRILDLFPGVDPAVNPPCYSVFSTPSRDEPCTDCPVVKTFQDGGQHTTEKQVSTCDGIHFIRMSSSAIIGREGKVTAAIEIIEDITERKRLENHLQQAQKMEAIGTLAGGIAHDFNNILTPILGYSEILMEELPTDSNEFGLVQQILSAGKRAKELVKQILTFSRQTEQEQQPVQIHLIIKEALKLLRSSIPTTIAIKQNVVDCGLVMADPTQIHQVLMNLCTNAYHAMRETGGELSVNLSLVEITPQDYLDNLALVPGPHVKLSVRDTGCGMTKEMQGRIFEPYFTTKKHGEGTGLGLSVVHGIVQSNHGHITVYSEPGKGTEFHVYLPRIKTQEKNLAEEVTVPIPRGNGTILVVDDEVAVGQLLRDMLFSLGYEVVLCSSSTQALETFQENSARIDLLLTDMTMPSMNGAELTRRIKQLNPAMPVVLCTGFSEIMDEEKAKRMGIGGYLFKPVNKRELAQTIHEVLKNKGPGGR